MQNKLNVKTSIGSNKNVLKSSYQQVYFYYDESRFQRFFMWVKEDIGIKDVELSKRLAYILGFQIINS